MIWMSLALARPPLALDVPFPTQRIFDKPDQVCLRVPTSSPDTDSTSVLGDFEVRCTARSGTLHACVQLLTDTWPDEVPPLQCGPDDAAVLMRPVPAFDPAEDIWDGVSLVRDVAVHQATYRVDHPDVPGILPGGRCGIADGRFEFKTKAPDKRQTCILVIGEEERRVPIRLVRRLPEP
ncbi:MAG: hypothetical protein AAF602_32730 [Myxococcota bacterium]